MFTLETYVILAILLLGGIIAVLQLKRRGARAAQLICAALVFVSLFAAYLIKLSAGAGPVVSAPVPFYKLFAINEYGYQGVFNDLIAYALPFLAFGFFLMPAFPKCGLFSAFGLGIFASVFLKLYPLFNDAPFVSDEYIFAGLGAAAGLSLYAILVMLLKKVNFIERFALAKPAKRGYTATIVYAIALYLGIAIVMILDHGDTYAPIQFFESETPLPEDIALNCTLDDSSDRAKLYGPSTQSVYDRTLAIALALNIDSPVTADGGTYTAEDATGRLTVTESGSWTYDRLTEPEGDAPTEVSAVAAVFNFFNSRTILSTALDSVTDIIERHDEAGAFAGYDIYLSTSINGMPIIGSSTLVVSIRAGNTITKIRRYDGDILSMTEMRIISQQRAYERLLDGACAYTLFSPATSASIENCYLAYMANSSQGYYLPVWVFACNAQLEDGTATTFDIYVEAMR